MYSVFIVDDEVNVRIVLKKLINWNNYGFEIAAEAEDGIEALRKIEADIPDLLIADINMPGKNGIDLIKEISEKGYKTKVLLLTGYRDFNYARTAVNYRVMGYLLKPVDELELIDNLAKIKKELENTGIYENAHNIIRERFLRSLAEGREKYGVLPINTEEIGIAFSENDAFAVMIVESESPSDNNFNDIDNECFVNEISDTIIDTVNAHLQGYLFRDSQERFCIILYDNNVDVLDKKVVGVAEEMRAVVSKLSRYTVTIGLSSILRGERNLKFLYSEAVKSLDAMFLLGKNRVIRYSSESFDSINKDFEKLHEMLNSLLKYIEEIDRTQTQVMLENIIEAIKKQNIKHNQFQQLIVEVLVGMSKIIRELNGDVSQVFGEEFDILEHIRKKYTLNDAKEWLESLINRTCEYIENIREKRPNSVIREVISYIRENYSADITLKSLAGRFYVNSLYLGQLFKKETGESFNDCLAGIRIENSIKLLKNTDLKVYEIAERVGYKEIQYFYKIFKNVTGSSPSIYR